MARRRSFLVGLERAARAVARAQREAEAAERRRIRDQLRNQREALRMQQVHERLQRQQGFASRQNTAQAMTADVAAQVDVLRGILRSRAYITRDGILASLKIQEDPPVLVIPDALLHPAPQPSHDAYIASVRPLSWWEKLFAYRARYEGEMASAEGQFRADYAKWQQGEKARAAEVAAHAQQHSQALAAYQDTLAKREEEIKDFNARYVAGDSDAVTTYFEIALDKSEWPEEFPHEFRIAYEAEAKQLVLDYELPTVDVVPSVAEYRYVKTKDAIEEKHRKPAEIKDVYRDIVASIALRCIHECFIVDGANRVDVLTFSGFVNSIDPATGNPIRPYLISVRVTRERFAAIVLDKVDTKACLRNLGAQVSPQPAELLPVKPIIEFDMVDKRFIDEKDVISGLDSRPNLMDLTPAEFEALVGNLFTRMGLETKLTRTSRDGGVDAIAFDMRPILGGKVVIQAKRYSHTVGVSAVRDLYGTMMNEGANKGILVTTSSYGPDAYDFCKDKPVELIDGAGLLYHLDQVGVKARIIFPTDQAAAT